MASTIDAAIRAAILADPADDAPRAVYADWLQEQESPSLRAYGKFIALQLEQARGNTSECLLASIDELLREHEWDWTPDRFWGTSGSLASLPCLRVVDSRWTRGFISEINLTTEHFIRHAAILFRQQPITRVVLRDKVPFFFVPRSLPREILEEPDDSGIYLWHVAWSGITTTFGRAHTLTRRLLPDVPIKAYRFSSRGEAVQWLSDQLVRRGRQLARLPELDPGAPTGKT